MREKKKKPPVNKLFHQALGNRRLHIKIKHKLSSFAIRIIKKEILPRCWCTQVHQRHPILCMERDQNHCKKADLIARPEQRRAHEIGLDHVTDTIILFKVMRADTFFDLFVFESKINQYAIGFVHVISIDPKVRGGFLEKLVCTLQTYEDSRWILYAFNLFFFINERERFVSFCLGSVTDHLTGRRINFITSDVFPSLVINLTTFIPDQMIKDLLYAYTSLSTGGQRTWGKN